MLRVANINVGPAGQLITEAIWNLFGVVDVTLFLWTRSNILAFCDEAHHDRILPPHSSLPSELKSSREEQEPED
jgi:hypothetical protein